MAYETAKQLLAQAVTRDDRRDALNAAMAAGMPLRQIEEYLDWLEATQHSNPREPTPTSLPRG